MSFLESLDMSASGMTAERLRMDVISNNLANVNTTRTPQGGPYRREEVVLGERGPSFADTLQALQAGQNGYFPLASGLEQSSLQGVEADGIVGDTSPFKQVYDPGNPDADPKGYVMEPNVNVVTEMVDMMGASRAYEANVTAVDAAKSMALKALEIGAV